MIGSFPHQGALVAFAIYAPWNQPSTNLVKHLIKKTFTLI